MLRQAKWLKKTGIYLNFGSIDMKLKTLLVTLLLFGISTLSSAGFSEATEAYNKGDYKTAFKEIKIVAEQGHASAQFNLGLMYSKGKGVLQDYKEAVKWYRKAAEQGRAMAQNNLGGMYATGTGVPKDMTKAKYWINKAYEGGSKLAKENWDTFKLWKY